MSDLPCPVGRADATDGVMPDWKVTGTQPVKVDVLGTLREERRKLFERTIPESRWVSLPPPIRLRRP